MNLIRSTKLNAKIDSEAGTVVMGSEAPSIHELVVEKTKAITGKLVRSHARRAQQHPGRDRVSSAGQRSQVMGCGGPQDIEKFSNFDKKRDALSN